MKHYVMNSIQLLLIWFALFMAATLLWRLFAPLLLVFLVFWFARRLWVFLSALISGRTRQTVKPRSAGQQRSYRPDKMVIDVESSPAGPDESAR